MQKLLFLAFGGALGTLSRYTLTTWLQGMLGVGFPYGTLACNMAGCFLIGFIISLLERGLALPQYLTLAVVTGFLGALTTFSTFELESVNLLKGGFPLKMALYMSISVVLGFAMVWAGFQLAKGLPLPYESN
ncbi:MAG: fluoride efflux transporter CrcB [Vampirovibrio sp.]|nr:fluoride efflux transporter CrcB [Vampirovibrio sp.]